jgi:tetratricopeptide (TPR) repeat protein
MAHWRSILPAGAMLEVSYEEVVNNLEEQARRLIDFCGLPWDDRCLSFHKTRRPISTASTVQVRQPVYRTSVQRWRRYEAYLQPLLTELESCREVRPGEKASSIRQQQKENTTTALSPSPGGLSEADALFALAERQSRAGHLIEAAATYRKLIAIRPTDAEGHNNLGNMLNALGKIDEAADHYQRAVTLKPNLAEAHNNLGNVLRDRGELGRALAHYEQALKLRPNFAEAHYYRSDLKTFRAGDPDLAALEALAADSAGLSPSKRLYIHFALGKALEDVGDYRRAFEHLLEGNALMRREVNHNDVANQQTIRGLASTFDSGTLARFQGVGDPTTVPIFVLGMPRSGSTLVEQILASHPQVHGGGELMNLNSTIVANSKVSGRSGLSRENPVFEIESFRRLGQAYVASLPPLPDGKTRITDKAPSNFFQIGLIRLILPNARIVHTMRDPADTCLSCFSRLFTRGQTYSYNLSELGRYYRGYHELMAHWRSILSAGAMLDVSYEEVVDNLEEQARRLIDFCGLPWDDRCLSFHKTRRPISTACTVQVRQPVYRTSVQRWRRYEAYLQPLLTELEGCGRY